MQHGAQSIRVHQPLFTTDPFCLLASLPDDQQRSQFKKQIDGMIINGQKVKLLPFRHQMASVLVPKMPAMHSVLSLQNMWDFTIYHYENSYKCWSGAAFAMSTKMQQHILKNKGLTFTAPKIVGPFELIINYLHGEAIDIKGTNAPFLLLMGTELGMKNLVSSVNSFLSSAKDPFTLIALILGYSVIGKIPSNL